MFRPTVSRTKSDSGSEPRSHLEIVPWNIRVLRYHPGENRRRARPTESLSLRESQLRWSRASIAHNVNSPPLGICRDIFFPSAAVPSTPNLSFIRVHTHSGPVPVRPSKTNQAWTKSPGSDKSHARRDSLSKIILQGILEGGRCCGQQRKCWMDNIKGVDVSAHARTAHKGLLQEGLEEDLC